MAQQEVARPCVSGKVGMEKSEYDNRENDAAGHTATGWESVGWF